jgi:hypothetical protein
MLAASLAGLFVVSVSNPPTQDARAGQGQIGSANNGFTVTLNAALAPKTLAILNRVQNQNLRGRTPSRT